MPIGCRRLPFPPALRNKQHARAVAFALARRLAGIPDGGVLTGGVAAHAKFSPRPDEAIRRPTFQFFLAHRATPPRFPQIHSKQHFPSRQNHPPPTVTLRAPKSSRNFRAVGWERLLTAVEWRELSAGQEGQEGHDLSCPYEGKREISSREKRGMERRSHIRSNNGFGWAR